MFHVEKRSRNTLIIIINVHSAYLTCLLPPLNNVIKQPHGAGKHPYDLSYF